jgi:hypothetical protein
VSDGGTWYRHDSSSNRKLVRGSKFPRAFSAPPSRFCDHRPSSLLSLATYATHPMVDERRNEFPSSDKRALALGIDKKRRVIERHCHITTAPSQLFFSISCESWLHYIHDFLLTNCIIGQTKKNTRNRLRTKRKRENASLLAVPPEEPLPNRIRLLRRRLQAWQEVQHRGGEQSRPDLAAEHHHQETQHERRRSPSTPPPPDGERRRPRLPLRRPRRKRPQDEGRGDDAGLRLVRGAEDGTDDGT